MIPLELLALLFKSSQRYQVAEALKILVEDFSAIRKTFFMFDIWSNQNHFIKLGKIKTDACLSCGSNRTYPYLSYENQTKANCFMRKKYSSN